MTTLHHRSIHVVALLLVAVVLAGFTAAGPLTADKIIASRQKKAQHIQDALAQLHIQLDNHRTGTKPLKGNRLKSVNSRVEFYEDQLALFARDLTDDEIQWMIDESKEDEL